MGRIMPSECVHGYIHDWGDFGCQEDECYGTCDLCPPEPCPVCDGALAGPAPANPERDNNGCMVYRR